MTGLEGVLNSLKGSELSLRLEAASVLKRLLKTKAAKGPIGQVVPQLLEGSYCTGSIWIHNVTDFFLSLAATYGWDR